MTKNKITRFEKLVKRVSNPNNIRINDIDYRMIDDLKIYLKFISGVKLKNNRLFKHNNLKVGFITALYELDTEDGKPDKYDVSIAAESTVIKLIKSNNLNMFIDRDTYGKLVIYCTTSIYVNTDIEEVEMLLYRSKKYNNILCDKQ